MKTRVITAVVLLPALLLIVLAAPKIYTAILLAAMCAIAAYELLAGTGLVKTKRLIVYSVIAALFIGIHSYVRFETVWLQIAFLAFWIILFAELMLCGMKLPFGSMLACIAAGILIPYLLTALVRIHAAEAGRFYILIPFVLAFLSDTGAYFAGRAFGKHKLAPVISPKKTVEGVVGGVFGAVLGMVIYCAVLQYAFDFTVNYLYAILYGILGSAGAVFGDLCFSVVKRQTGIKDYGNLFPGHGGILDRFDSMTIVAPLVEVLLILLPLAV